MPFIRNIAVAALAALSLSIPALAEESPKIRIGMLEGGPVSWEVQTIRDLGLDQKHGFVMTPIVLPTPSTAQIALKANKVDAIAADWLWVSGARSRGEDYTIAPIYGFAGSLLVKSSSPVQGLADLKGRRLGIIGGPDDATWLMLQAQAQKVEGFDLAAETQQIHASPEALEQALANGKIDALVMDWPFEVLRRRADLREVASMATAQTALSLDPAQPTEGYVLRSGWVGENPDLAQGFLAAAAEARGILATDDAQWEQLRKRTGAADDATFDELRADYRAGIAQSWDADKAQALFTTLSEVQGGKLTGGASAIAEGTIRKDD